VLGQQIDPFISLVHRIGYLVCIITPPSVDICRWRMYASTMLQSTYCCSACDLIVLSVCLALRTSSLLSVSTVDLLTREAHPFSNKRQTHSSLSTISIPVHPLTPIVGGGGSARHQNSSVTLTGNCFSISPVDSGRCYGRALMRIFYCDIREKIFGNPYPYLPSLSAVVA